MLPITGLTWIIKSVRYSQCNITVHSIPRNWMDPDNICPVRSDDASTTWVWTSSANTVWSEDFLFLGKSTPALILTHDQVGARNDDDRTCLIIFRSVRLHKRQIGS